MTPVDNIKTVMGDIGTVMGVLASIAVELNVKSSTIAEDLVTVKDLVAAIKKFNRLADDLRESSQAYITQ